MAFNPDTYFNDVKNLQDQIDATNREITRLENLRSGKAGEIESDWNELNLENWCISHTAHNSMCNSVAPSFTTFKMPDGRVNNTIYGFIGQIKLYDPDVAAWIVIVRNTINSNCDQRDDYAREIVSEQNDMNALTIQLNNLKNAYTAYITAQSNANTANQQGQVNIIQAQAFSDFIDKYGFWIVLVILIIIIAIIWVKYGKKIAA